MTAKNRPNQSFRILLSKNCSLALWPVSVLQFQIVSAFSVGTYGCPTVSGIFNTIHCLQLIISVAYSFSSRVIKKHFQDLQVLFSADHYLLLVFIYVCPLKVLPDLIENVRPSYLAIAGVAKVIQDLLEPACNLGIVSTCCNAVTYNICCVIWNAQFMTFYCTITANNALNTWKKGRMTQEHLILSNSTTPICALLVHMVSILLIINPKSCLLLITVFNIFYWSWRKRQVAMP